MTEATRNMIQGSTRIFIVDLCCLTFWVRGGQAVDSEGHLSGSTPFMPYDATNRRHMATRHYRRLRISVFTRTNALLEKLSLHGIARERERRSEVLAGDFISPAVKFELAERGVEERVGGEAIAAGDGANLFEPAFGAFVLRDGDGAVQRNDRGRTYRHQRVVK